MPILNASLYLRSIWGRNATLPPNTASRKIIDYPTLFIACLGSIRAYTDLVISFTIVGIAIGCGGNFLAFMPHMDKISVQIRYRGNFLALPHMDKMIHCRCP